MAFYYSFFVSFHYFQHMLIVNSCKILLLYCLHGHNKEVTPKVVANNMTIFVLYIFG